MAKVPMKLTATAQPIFVHQQTCFATKIDVPTAAFFDFMPVSPVEA
jgi:hypothetical protein